MKKQSIIFLILILSINLINALSVNIPSATTSTIVVTNLSTNSTDYWDNLDTPADILGSTINNDLGWITSAGANTWQGNVTNGMSQDLNINSKQLTDVGELIMNGLIRSQNMTPITHNLYSLGNSTNWFKEIWVKNIYADDINTTNLIASDINTNNLDSVKTNTTNLTIGGFDVFKDGEGDLNINLD